jgi:hypothetical protein
MSATHEDFTRGLPHRGPTDRNFGWVFTIAFSFFGLWPLRHGRPIRPALLALSGAILLITLLRPSLLHWPNVVWTRIGVLLGKVVSPVVTALLFYLVFTPAAFVLRRMGKDVLHLKTEPQAATYWIARNPQQEETAMVNQF